MVRLEIGLVLVELQSVLQPGHIPFFSPLSCEWEKEALLSFPDTARNWRTTATPRAPSMTRCTAFEITVSQEMRFDR